MSSVDLFKSWGKPPWEHDFSPKACPLPSHFDIAVIGGGFTGLAAAAWVRRCEPDKTVGIFERFSLGSGGSGRTGGITLAETASGDLPELGNVLEGFKATLADLGVDCDAVWNGVYEIAHGRNCRNAVLEWQDSGPLDVANEVPGGCIDPGLLLGGLARTAENLGTLIFEHAPVDNIHFEQPIRLDLSKGEVCAEQVLFATNACALELSGLNGAQPMLTLALATEPLSDEDLEAIGLKDGKPFYTVDLPYLWGRTLRNNGVVFGCGLVFVKDWRELDGLDIHSGEPARLLDSLEDRVRGLHPVLHDVKISHRWGGPILFPADGCLFFHTHSLSPNVIVLGGYTGQGVTLSVHLGRWAAEALLGKKNLPAWNLASGKG